DVVVDLAIGDQRQAAVITAHRHVPERTQVQDAQALAGEGAATEGRLTAGVGPAMLLNGRHGRERGHVRRGHALAIEVVDACDAAHGRAVSYQQSAVRERSTRERATTAGVPEGTSTRSVRRVSGRCARTE